MALLLASSCAPKPEPVEYGADMCHFCKMSIVSRQHAAEAVTSKGKVYKFDATECLVHFLKEQNGTEYAYLLASDYERPGTLMPAESSTYLISPQMPSPMGAFLSAFSSPERAQAFQQEKGGEVLSWQQLQERLRE